MEDTIAAIVTSSSISSVGIIRISGKDSFKIIKKIFKPKKENFKIEHQKIRYGHIIDNNEIIDEVLISFFKEPISFTRENVCEINCHGGTVILNRILNIVLKNGARMAEPGEFTKRAFLNGRIDLAQAEAVIDIINAKTEKCLKESQKQLEGVLSNKINEIENEILEILSDIEANIDYPEYDIEEVTNEKLIKNIESIKNKLEILEKSFDTGKILREGINIAIIGKPNVGKSSILNMLLREERAIVTDVAGTTRDTIEEYINIEGIPVKIIDTAGIRQSDNVVEKIGIEKSIEISKKADIILVVFDYSEDFTQDDYDIIEKINKKDIIILLNKIDLKNKLKKEEIEQIFKNKKIIEISAKEKIGLEKLEKTIYNMCNLDNVIKENETVLINARHKNIVSGALNKIDDINVDINNKTPIDIVSVKIMDILQLLGEITGKTVNDEIISKIFSKFCLGK